MELHFQFQRLREFCIGWSTVNCPVHPGSLENRYGPMEMAPAANWHIGCCRSHIYNHLRLWNYAHQHRHQSCQLCAYDATQRISNGSNLGPLLWWNCGSSLQYDHSCWLSPTYFLSWVPKHGKLVSGFQCVCRQEIAHNPATIPVELKMFCSASIDSRCPPMG